MMAAARSASPEAMASTNCSLWVMLRAKALETFGTASGQPRNFGLEGSACNR
jgi:hypothetical protein